MPEPAIQYIPYSDSIEVPQPDEEKVFDEIAATMRGISETIGDRARHTTRAVHSKSHGLLKGTLTVADGLPPWLAQGLFAKATAYPVILRLSTNPGDILPDSISTPRGMALKVFVPEGELMVDGHQGEVTQDFLLVDAKAFDVPDASAFLKNIKLIASHATDPELLKQLVSTTARAVETVIETVGKPTPLRNFGHPQTHILGETYCSLAALRYGDYVAKICVTPASENLKALVGKHLHAGNNYSAIRDAVVEFFKTQGAEWNVNAQLCADLKTMPVEDPSVEWPEAQSPYQVVARISVPAQNAYSPERQVYVDEVLSFNPWHALAAHRPLGNIMRARRKSYAASSQFRHAMNVRSSTEPKKIDELPD